MPAERLAVEADDGRRGQFVVIDGAIHELLVRAPQGDDQRR
jgi:hypothetical protein